MTRKRRIGLVALAGVAVAIVAGFFGMRFGYEHAHYEVVQEHRAFELRRYEPRIVAEVTVTADDPERASNQGFRLLADYIFGNNIAGGQIAMTSPVDTEQAGSEKIAMTTPVDVERASEKIAMTTPVDVERASEKIAMTAPVDRSGSDGRWTVRFTMPSEYSLAQLPKPVDTRVQLREQPAKLFAAVRFSGSPDEAFVQQRMADLLGAVSSAGLTPATERSPLYARYDPPWTPSILKRNEVLIELVSTG